MFDPITARIDLALAAMNAAPPANRELDALFNRLRRAHGERERATAEQRIWSFWCSHEDERATHDLQGAMAALQVGDLVGAGDALNDLVERWPDWAEAYNKRATVHFMEDRDVESLDDIVRTLEREPRHFGALGGLGQICLHNGQLTSALMVFERVLSIDPGLDEMHDMVVALRKETRHSIH